MAKAKRHGVFISSSNRPDIFEVIDALKRETGIAFSAELVYQALRQWLTTLRRKAKKLSAPSENG